MSPTVYETERERDGAVFLVRTRPSGNNNNAVSRRHISPWHDVPMRPSRQSRQSGSRTLVHMVCEVPRGNRAKLEVAIDEPPLTPLRRDRTADGKPRSYPSRMPWNYGMVPRTWEDPGVTVSVVTGGRSRRVPGDGDPLDVVEIGSRRCEPGGVYAVRLLGALALIDGGELDWKLIAIRVDDPLEKDILASLGDTVDRIRRWFVEYKPGSGNSYAFGGRLMGARAVVKEGHAAYVRRLREGR